MVQATLKKVLPRSALRVPPGRDPIECRTVADKHQRAITEIERLGGQVMVANGRRPAVRVRLDENWGGGNGGLMLLQDVRNLRTLTLWKLPIADEDVGYLMPLHDLEQLFVYSANVGDAGLVRLWSLPQLRELYLVRTRVTVAGVRRLEKLCGSHDPVSETGTSAGTGKGLSSAFMEVTLIGDVCVCRR